MNYSGLPLNVENMTSPNVDNLSCHASCDTLKRILQDCVPIVNMCVPMDRSTTESHSFAMVHFHNKHDAEQAMSALTGIKLKGHNLRVQLLDNEGSQLAHNGHHRGKPQWQCEEEDNESQSQSQKHQYTLSSNASRLSRSQNTSHLGQSHSRPYHPSYIRSASTRMSNSTFRSCVQTRSLSRSRSLRPRCRKKFKSRSPSSIACKGPEEGENMENNQRLVENAQIESIFRSSNVSEGNVTEASVTVSPNRRCSRARIRNPNHPRDRDREARKDMKNNQIEADYPQDTLTFSRPNLEEHAIEDSIAVPTIKRHTCARGRRLEPQRERRWIEKKYMKNSQMQVEYTQSASTFASPGIEEHAIEDCIAVPTIKRCTCARGRSPEPERKTRRIESRREPLFDMPAGDSEIFDNVTERAIREYPSWSATNQRYSDNHDVNRRVSFNLNNENPNPREDHLYFARLLAEQTMEYNQRQVENSRSRSPLAKQYQSQRSATESVPPSRHQEKTRCRSPYTCQERAWTESDVPTGDSERGQFTSFQQSENMAERELLEHDFLMSITHSNLHRVSGGMSINLKNENINPQNDDISSAGLESNMSIQNQVDNPESESTFTRPLRSEINTTLLDDPPIIDGRRIRHWEPEIQITEVNNENTSPQNHMSDALLRFHYYISPETFDTIRENDAEIFSSIQPNLPMKEDVPMLGLQSRDIFTSSSTRNALSTEYSPHTTSNNESDTLGPTSSSTHFYLSGAFGPEREYPLTVSVAYRSQFTSVTPRNYFTFESDWEECINMTSHSSQTNIQTYTEIHVHETSDSGLNLTSLDNYGGLGQVMTGHSGLHPGQNNEINESTGENIIYDDNSNSSSHRAESSLSFTDISNLTLAEIVRRSSRSRQSNSHSNEISTVNAVRNAANVSYEIPAIVREENQRTSPVISDENDSWPLPPFFLNINEDNFNHSAGLNKQQINNFAVRDYCEDDALNFCSVCITEYTEGCKIRILPCFHEYHDHCIDRWLSQNATCPICRRQLKISDDIDF